MSLRNLSSEAYTVSGLTHEIKALLEGNFPIVRLRGEISNLRSQQSGHVYFSLKDEGAAISCVCFRGDASRLQLKLRDGLQIVGTGRITVYEPRGNYQIIFRTIEEDGIGRLQRAFLELKEKLSAEGLFDPERKKPLPRLPATIGIVTSDTGAALRDFISILRRRDWHGRLIVIPSRVQGTGAAEEIVRGISLANEHSLVDLLVVGRGGGSLEDLWPFNEERVARAVAASTIPVISAVGHEIDFTLSDFAADYRAETPSAAAEWITSARLEYLERSNSLGDRLHERFTYLFERKGHRLALASSEFKSLHPRNQLEQAALRLDDLQNRLGQFLLAALRHNQQNLKLLQYRFHALQPERQIRHLRDSLRQISLRLHNNSHQATLNRGYAILRSTSGNVLTQSREIPPDSTFFVGLKDGEFQARRGKNVKK